MPSPRPGLALAICLASLLAALPATATDDPSPPSIDLRPAFAEWQLPPRSQGGRGTCSVFTLAAAIEYALAHQRGHATPLSVEFLNWASNDAIGQPHDGGFFSDLWTGFLAHGICPETDMPYQPRFDPKLRPTEQALHHARQLRHAGLRLHWIKRWNVKTGLTDAQFARIKQTLAQKWPVCGGFRWPKQQRWTDGLLQMAPPEDVFDGHSVLLVGYRDDPQLPGGGLFLIRNSNRPTAESALSYEYVRAYMNDAVWIDHAPPAAP